MIRKIVLLSLLSTVIPVMGMQQQFSKTTDQQEYSEEDYKNFIQSHYLTTESKPTKFFQGFINFIKNKSLLDQSIILTKFVYALTAPERAQNFSQLLPKIEDELLTLPLETVLYSGLIPTFVGLKKNKLEIAFCNKLLKFFKEKSQDNSKNLAPACTSLSKKMDPSSEVDLTMLTQYISSCTILELKPAKEILQKIPNSGLLSAEITDELIIERARGIHSVQEYEELLEDGQLILKSNPTLLCAERNSKKIKKYYEILFNLQQLSLKPTIEQIQGFNKIFQKINPHFDSFQEDLRSLHPLTLLQNPACHKLLAKKLESTNFEKIFQDASRLNLQEKLAEFCLTNKMPINDWASYALEVLDPKESALIQKIQKSVQDKEKKERRKINQRLNKALQNESLPNNDLSNEKEPSIVSSVASSINTIELSNRFTSLNQLSTKTTAQLSSEEKAAQFENKIALLYKTLELESAEDFQTIPHTFQNTFYDHAKAHTITAEEALQLKKIKILNANDLLAQDLELEKLMENRTILTAFILPASNNLSDGFIRYVQETLLENSDKIDIAERSFEEKEGTYIGMRWKTKTPFDYIEFTKEQEDFIVKIKEGYHFTGALDEKGNPLTIYPVECSEKSLAKEISQLSLSETGNTSFKKKVYQEKK